VKRRHARTCPKDDKTCKACASTTVKATLSAINRWPIVEPTRCLSRQHGRAVVRPSLNDSCLAFPAQLLCKTTRPGRHDPLVGPCSCRTLLWHAIENTVDSLFCARACRRASHEWICLISWLLLRKPCSNQSPTFDGPWRMFSVSGMADACALGTRETSGSSATQLQQAPLGSMTRCLCTPTSRSI
jgi:hypothetical protein